MISSEDKCQNKPEYEKDLEHFKEWCNKQPHFPKHLKDKLLISCLQSNHYRLELAKKTLDKYLTIRTHTPEFFSNRDPLNEKNQGMIKTVIALPLQRSPEGYFIIFIHFIKTEPKNFNFYDFAPLILMICDFLIWKNGPMPGYSIIIDVDFVKMSHIIRLPPMGLKKLITYLQDASPILMKNIHFLHSSSAMEFALSIIRPFTKNELFNKMLLHPTVDSLVKYIPIETLPNELGGKAGSLLELDNKIIKELEDNRDYLIEEEIAMRIDESKRPEKQKMIGESLYIDGNFKTIDID